MKNIFVFVLCFSVFLTSCDFSNVKKNSHVRDENYERIADGITAKIAQKMKKEKALQCIGTGGGMMSNIQRMAISFQFFHEVDLDEARELIVTTTSEYLKAINGSKEVRPYLENYPFGLENVEVMIWIKEPDGHDVPFDQIAQVTLARGMISYYSYKYDPGNSYQTLHRESYDEALKIVNERVKAS